MTAVIESDYLSALTMQSEWFFLVLITFWQITAVCRQRPTRNACCGRETARCRCKIWYYRNVQRHRAVIPAIARLLFI